jgi:hypothetical protein
VLEPFGIKTRYTDTVNKSNAATMKCHTLKCKNESSLYSTSSESMCVRVVMYEYIYIITVIIEMSKRPCKKYLGRSEKGKKKE